METVDTSAEIKFLIEIALKGEITWHNLDSIINRLSPTLEKSKLIIRALVYEFKSHQSICSMKQSEDIIEIDENQYNTDEGTLFQEKSSEEDEIEFLEESQLSKESIKIQSEEKTSENDFSNEQHESKRDISESENEEVFDENDVTKNVQLVEAFKGQLYTFVGDDAKEKPKTDNYNESLNGDETFHHFWKV